MRIVYQLEKAQRDRDGFAARLQHASDAYLVRLAASPRSPGELRQLEQEGRRGLWRTRSSRRSPPPAAACARASPSRCG